MSSKACLGLSVVFLMLGALPAQAGVMIDLHYQGLDEIQLSDLPADGRITLDVDVTWDGELPGLIGLEFSTFFDPGTVNFIGGTTNKSTIFANASGLNGLTVYGTPVINYYRVASAYQHLWPINQVTTVSAIRFPGSPDHPGTESSVASLTFDVHDVATFELDLGFGQGGGLIFRESTTAPMTFCLRDEGGGATHDQTECIEAGLISFDGFRVVDGARVAPALVPVFVPEPNVALLIGLGLAALSLGRRSVR